MVTKPEIKTALPGPKAAAIIARDAKRISTSYTRDYPFVMAKGEGAVVEDVDGNVFLDCAAGIAVTGTGHSHPNVVKAIDEIVRPSQKSCEAVIAPPISASATPASWRAALTAS